MEWVLPFIIVIVTVGIIWAGREESKRKALAKRNYKESLETLKNNPVNADLRQKTLKFGRVYSNLMRNSKGNTVFDEVALMNDINAACAATHQSIDSQNSSNMQASVEDRLRNLLSLKEMGLIDEDEFIRRKQEIIASI